MITNEHPEKFADEQYQNFCYACIIGKLNPENYLNKDLKEILLLIKDQQMKKYNPLVEMDS